MQIGGIGSNHNSDMHQVTNCKHNHSVKKQDGNMSMTSSTQSQVQQSLQESLEMGMSFQTWVKNLLSGAKSLWGRIWGENAGGDASVENSSAVKTDESGTQTIMTPLSIQTEESVMSQGFDAACGNPAAQSDMRQTAKVTLAAEAVSPPNTYANNPYFSAIEDTGKQQETLWQKVRVKFQNVAGYLTKHFSFSNRNTFQAKQEKPKEDLSRRSRYRRDDIEIDCVLTDESYLMDSYNKKGEYSTLSANNRGE